MERREGGWESRGEVNGRWMKGFLVRLKIALSIEGSGEGSVVQCPGWCSMTSVGWHPHDAILCLFRGKFSPELLYKYIRLWTWKGNCISDSYSHFLF